MQHNLKLGTLYSLISALAYTFVTVIVKRYAHEVPAPVMVFFQLSCALILFLPFVLYRGRSAFIPIINSKHKVIHFFRAVFSLGIGYFLYTALQFIPLVNGVLLLNTAPLLVPLLGYLFFHKKIVHQLWLPIIIGFIGVAFVLHPDGSSFNLGSIIAFGSAIFMGLSALLLRKASEGGDNSITTTCYYFFFGTIISGLVSIPFWHVFSATIYFYLILSGVLFFMVQFAYSLAFQYSEATFVTSMYYSNVLFAAIVGVVLFQEMTGWLTYAGLVLIILGGLATIQVQRKVNQRGH